MSKFFKDFLCNSLIISNFASLLEKSESVKVANCLISRWLVAFLTYDRTIN